MLVFLTPSPPFSCFATGGDSLESKVIFIQLSEWGSPLECVTNKEFTARAIAPQDTAAEHADIAAISSNSLRIGRHRNTYSCSVCVYMYRLYVKYVELLACIQKHIVLYMCDTFRIRPVCIALAMAYPWCKHLNRCSHTDTGTKI